jgi:hypothetical protein
MKLGFTGTREDITQAQTLWLTHLFNALQIEVLHHGACVGADHAAHLLALQRNIPVVVHPPVKTKFLARECLNELPGVQVLPAKPYLVRDRDIVACTDGLAALPKGPEPKGLNLEGIGGTWYTIQFALRMNKPVMICYPDGEVDHRKQRDIPR